MTLTKDDVTAMRQATGFVIHGAGDLAWIRCIKRIKSRTSGPFSADEKELEHEIPGIPCRISMSNGSLFQRQRGSKGTASRLYADGAWTALAALARAGDSLEIHFTENSNGYLKGVTEGQTEADSYSPGFRFYDLHHDQCQATLYRTDKYDVTRAVIDHLVLDDCTCPNNSARMIQH
jgi:hypothetical protein|tara:strand:- start:205 stop:735 length:531 start_codon:yes stop_codon:yes gene_type:complete